MKSFILIITTLMLSVTCTVKAEQHFGFANVSINYWDWSEGTQNRSGKRSFAYLGTEAGAGYDWGDIYGFVYIQNPTKGDWKQEQVNKHAADQFRIEAKATVNVNIGDSKWNIYGDLFNFSDSAGGYEQNLIAGISYEINTTSGIFFRPFLGAHYVHNSGIGAGFNGVMTGWIISYDFNIKAHKFSFFNWHEIELARADEYVEINGSNTGINGSASLWYKPNERLSVGIQYRYANNKLGANTYHNGIIYSLKYNF